MYYIICWKVGTDTHSEYEVKRTLSETTCLEYIKKVVESTPYIKSGRMIYAQADKIEDNELTKLIWMNDTEIFGF